MSAFTDTDISALIDAETVENAMLLELHFASGIFRISDRSIDWNDGTNIWKAGSSWVGMSEIQRASDTRIIQRTYSISPINTEVAAIALGERTEYKNRPAKLFTQFFADRVPVGDKIALDYSLMDTMQRTVNADGTFKISLTAESLLAKKGAAPFGFLTPADQERRHPGDLGLEFVMELDGGKTVSWPEF